MDVDELMHVVRTEHLDTPVLYGVGDLYMDAVVLERGGGVWRTHLTDDQSAIITHTMRTFNDETAALWAVLRKLRQIAEARRTGAALPDHAGSRRSVDFAPRSMRTGATLPDGAGRVITSLEIRIADLSTTKVRHDQWLADGIPLFARGDAWIVPLSWEPALIDGDDAQWPSLQKRATEITTHIRVDCGHRHGSPIWVDLDPETGKSGYATELRRNGARDACWWRFGNTAMVCVVYGEPLPAPKTLTAVQVVPIDWVRDSRGRGKLKQKIGADLSWSWADVVEFTRVDTRNDE
ncbi:hypothetical protein ACTU6U_00765 [Microbacterium sp. A196]|uniref:hypothetical protein n=1 Tax=unclassified Microbacterium TaxID=2609290 RepID=UPI003FD3EFC6